MSAAPLLVDKSAWVRGVDPDDHVGELCICAVTRLEILYSARSATDHDELDMTLDAFRELRADAETWRVARTAQRELARLGLHRFALPDLLIAACAQQHHADVLHVDRHFDVLARVLAFTAVRSSERT